MKPQMIEVIHTASSYYEVRDIERDLGIKWEDVERYTVRWGDLHLTMKGGQELKFDIFEDHGAVCWERPYKVNELVFGQAGKTVTRRTIQ